MRYLNVQCTSLKIVSYTENNVQRVSTKFSALPRKKSKLRKKSYKSEIVLNMEHLELFRKVVHHYVFRQSSGHTSQEKFNQQNIRRNHSEKQSMRKAQ